jgi:hypothetical protein
VGFRRRTAKSAAPPPFAVLSKLEVGQKILFFMAFLCVSQQGEFKNTTKTFLGRYITKKNAKKLKGGETFFPAISPFDIFLTRFWRFSACCVLRAVCCALRASLCPLSSMLYPLLRVWEVGTPPPPPLRRPTAKPQLELPDAVFPEVSPIRTSAYTTSQLSR